MKVLPIQQYNYSKNNQRTSFKGAKLYAAMTQAGIPSNHSQFKSALGRLTRAAHEEATKIYAPAMFQGLRESCDSTIDFTIYMSKAIMNEKPGTAAVMAEDYTGPLVTIAKASDRQFVQFSSGGSVLRFGLTEPQEDKTRHLFFQSPDVYVDYHDEFGTPAGGMRKYQDAFSDAKYFDREGNREFGVGLRGLFQAIFG